MYLINGTKTFKNTLMFYLYFLVEKMNVHICVLVKDFKKLGLENKRLLIKAAITFESQKPKLIFKIKYLSPLKVKLS